ncbi:ComEC/Rec2 family competence protein [Sphingomonas daechungensis]|uniref:ComEC/Rec2 family competence protein n=1 Tax=Sphingomonas daechungensis TaxID=1176646 RepID=UPI003782FE3F
MGAPNIGSAHLPQHARGYWKARFSASREEVEHFLERERGQLPLWLVASFGMGIAFWFALNGPREWLAVICLGAGAAVAGFSFGTGRLERAVGWVGLAAAIGCGLIWLRSEWAAAPRLDRPKVVTFEAVIAQVEQLPAKGDIRLTVSPLDKKLPPLVRVSLKADGAPSGIAAGAKIALKARLAPPPPMALPGTHDFARDAWFKGLGAVGRALGPVEVLQPAEPGWLDSLRDRLDRHIRERLPGPSGTIATALVTGDQNAVSEEDADAMRRSGLAHLLSVSGLHIAAVVGAVMFLALKLLALSERVALRFNLVLVSAAAAAAAGIGYTLLTGAQVPTVRSCVAALLVLGGIALGREAISLRLVAVGALAVLIFRPEALAGPSFQFSFAAVTAIIALHSSGWGQNLLIRRDEGPFAKAGRTLLGMILTGLVVEVALMPLALYHFHKAGLFGVAANLVAIPLTTFVIMPVEAAALFLDPIGLGTPFWWASDKALAVLLSIAHTVAGAKGAVATLPSMPAWAFASMVLGGLWFFLWTTARVRLLGLVPVAVGAAAAAVAPSPDVLITGDGRHLAIVAPDGTPMMLRDRSGDFMRDLVSEASGFDDEPGLLAESSIGSCSRDSCVAVLKAGARNYRLLATRSANSIDWKALTDACAEADIVVSDRWLPKSCAPQWLKFDRKSLVETGGLAIFLDDQPRVETVSRRVGDHPWAE